MVNRKKAPRVLNETYLNQINVLHVLSQDSRNQMDARKYQIQEIADMSGLRDEKETQRYLFILEGQKLVSPFPAGDFTSKTWQITGDGLRAVRAISKAGVL